MNIDQYLKSKIKTITEVATDGFNQGGRGAVVIDRSDPDKVEFVYGAADELKANGYSDESLYRLLGSYDPQREIVVAVLLSDEVKYFRLKAYPLAE